VALGELGERAPWIVRLVDGVVGDATERVDDRDGIPKTRRQEQRGGVKAPRALTEDLSAGGLVAMRG
jgi:hypothetical protein